PLPVPETMNPPRGEPTMIPGKIDVHHHVLPPQFLADLARRGAQWTGGPAVPDWSVPMALETMDRCGIATAIASTVPQVPWGAPAAAARWARHCNEFLAGVIGDPPQRFGGFASLPLPDTEAACRELAHAYDVLGLDGVILMASYGVQYLG